MEGVLKCGIPPQSLIPLFQLFLIIPSASCERRVVEGGGAGAFHIPSGRAIVAIRDNQGGRIKGFRVLSWRAGDTVFHWEFEPEGMEVDCMDPPSCTRVYLKGGVAAEAGLEIEVKATFRGRMTRRHRAHFLDPPEGGRGLGVYPSGDGVQIEFESRDIEGLERVDLLVRNHRHGREEEVMGRYRVAAPLEGSGAPLRYGVKGVEPGVDISVQALPFSEEGVMEGSPRGHAVVPAYRVIPLLSCRSFPAEPPEIKGGIVIASCPEDPSPRIFSLSVRGTGERYIPLPLGSYMPSLGGQPEILIPGRRGVERFDLFTEEITEIRASARFPLTGFSTSPHYISWLERDGLRLFDRAKRLTYIIEGSPVPWHPPYLSAEYLLYLEGMEGERVVSLVHLDRRYRVPLSEPLSDILSLLLVDEERGGWNFALWRERDSIRVFDISRMSETSIPSTSPLYPRMASDGEKVFFEEREGEGGGDRGGGLAWFDLSRKTLMENGERIKGNLPAAWGDNLLFFRKDSFGQRLYARIPTVHAIDDKSPFFVSEEGACRPLTSGRGPVRERGYFYREGFTRCQSASPPFFIFKNLVDQETYEIYFSGEGVTSFRMEARGEPLFTGELEGRPSGSIWQRLGRFRLPAGEIRVFLPESPPPSQKVLIYDALLIKEGDGEG